MYYNLSTTKKPKPKKNPAKKHPVDKKLLAMTVVVLLASLLLAFGITKLIQHLTPAPEEPTQIDQPTAIDANTDLNLAFLQIESNKQNLIYSPLSIKNGLSLLNAGAAGTTKAQIENILGDVAILGKTATIKDKLSLANGVFIRNEFRDYVLKTYASNIEKSYNAEIVYSSFENSKTVDDWVKTNTLGLIDQLGFTPRESIEMILVNALAIQLDWLHQFKTSDTTGRIFYTADGKELTATTLTETTSSQDIRYYQDDSVTMLGLPLEKAGDAELEFITVMPSTDLDSYIKSFNLADFNSKLASSTTADTVKDGIVFYIPKFSFDYELKFKNDLIRLGVTDAFSSSLADFSNMASKPIYVSDAIHKANIDFSEKGIKAAAVTAAVMTIGSTMLGSEPQPLVIQIDHPFLFLIRDKNNDAIWFLGTVYQPNLWSDDAASYQM